ncbi:MAG: FecR domain-containing protein [Gemmatimonadaceae bacterium]|nr:FecR domain-containing protein [Gemmatimonadaceae bacterium]
MTDDLRTDPTMGGDAEGEALARFFAGESDPAEAAVVEAWLASHPEEQTLLSLLKSAEAQRDTRREREAPLIINAESALETVRARMQAYDASTMTPSAGRAIGETPLRVERGGLPPAPPLPSIRRSAAPARRRAPWRALGFAAAAGLVAMLVMRDRKPDAPTFAQEYRTEVGNTDTLTLVDGTQVVLAPGSTLKLADTYAAGARDLTLDGAAHFTVTHDASRPFVVHVGAVAVRDIGTAFTVKSMAEGGVAVVVTEGRVAVAPRGASSAEVELAAGDRGDVIADSLRVERGVAGEAEVAWTRGELAYRDAPLAEVRADLWRWYGVTLEVSDPVLSSRTITTRFAGDSLSQVLQVLSLALGADIAQSGDTVRLVPQSIPQGAPPAARR